MGPNELGWLESGLSALAHTRLSSGERLDAVVLILGHLRNLVQQRTTTPASGPEQDLNAQLRRILAEHGSDYPEASAAFASATSNSQQGNALEFGLERILDGLAVLADSR